MNPQTSFVRAVLLLLVTAVAGCAVCKSTDTAEQCRTKERNHGQTRASIPGATSDRALIKHARLEQNAAIVDHNLDAIASYCTDDVTSGRGLGIQLAGKAAYRKLFEEDDPASKDLVI